MCGSMADIQSAAAEIRRGIKKKKERTNHSMKIYMVSLLHRATIISYHADVRRDLYCNVMCILYAEFLYHFSHNFIIAGLCNTAGHYIFAFGFCLLSSSFLLLA